MYGTRAGVDRGSGRGPLGGSGVPRRRSVHVLAPALVPVELLLNVAFRELTLATVKFCVATFAHYWIA